MEPTKFVSPDDLENMRGLGPGRRVFGRYRLEKIAGRGGMGVVWRARDEQLERIVALKFLPDDVAADVEAVRDLKIETKRCLELTHPQIVRVYDFVQGPAGAAIAMEFVEGESLAARKAASENGCLSVAEISQFLGQLCAALDYAHFKAHILHRDLKPANLLITKEGELKVMDFGIACSLAETRTRLTAVATRSTSGTPLYMSPQHLMGEKPCVADDVYALGATLYELLTGKPPFYRGDAHSLVMQVREKQPKPMAEQRADLQVVAEPVPPEWEAVILSCLAKDPGARPSSAGEVAKRLGLAIGPTTGIPGSRKLDLNELLKKRRAAIGSAAAVLAIIALAGGYMFFGRGSHPTPTSARKSSPSSSTVVAAPEPVAPEPKKTAAAPSAKLGGVIVRTEPAGAEVTVGSLDHGVGPLTLREVKTGTYPVRVKAPGYEDWSGEVEVTADDFAEITATLVRSTGTLLLTSEPAGLEAELVGKNSAGGPPLADRMRIKTPQNLKLPTGNYEITFRRAGWPDQHAAAEVARNEHAESAASFVPGTLVVTSEPIGAKVMSGGRTLGVTPLTLADVPPGAQNIELRLNGYQMATLTGVVAARKDLKLHAVLERPGMPEIGRATMLADIDLELEYVAPGTFVMGSPETEAHREDEEGPQTEVTFTQGYWLGKTEVTQGQYEAVMGANPSRFKAAGKNAAVENVTWLNAMDFCRRLTDRERAAGRLPAGFIYSLPTEAQWENACRAGTTGPYAGEMSKIAWFDKQGGKTTHPVATKAPNAWGFFDMHGNVWEWCLDTFLDHLPGGSVSDYVNHPTGSRRVYRGGSWDNSEDECRSAIRVKGSSDDHEANIGFRIALAPQQSNVAEAPEAKSTSRGFGGTVKSAWGSIVKVVKPGDSKSAATGNLMLTINHAPPPPWQCLVTATRLDVASGPIEFALDENATKSRTATGAVVLRLPLPPGNYSITLRAAGFKDTTRGSSAEPVVIKSGENQLEVQLAR